VTHNTLAVPFTSSVYSSWNNVGGEDPATSGLHFDDNIVEMTNTWMFAVNSGVTGCRGFTGGSRLAKNLVVDFGQVKDFNTATYYDIGDDCQTWAWPLKRTGTGVASAVDSATISGGYLKIALAGGHGLMQSTKIKLAGWSPSGLNATYTVPRLCCGTANVTDGGDAELWLPTVATGTVTRGTIEASVDYANWAAKNFRLAATSVYKGWASDGSDPGANQDTVEWATAGASSGADNPYLDFRVRSITPTSDGAVLRFTAYSTAACAWTIDSTRAFSGSLGGVSQTRTGRDGTATITGLARSTRHWYRVACDSKTRDGEFVSGR